MVSKLFGSSKDKKKAAAPKDPIETMKRLNQECENLDRKKKINETRITECIKTALDAKHAKNNSKAIMMMKRKAMYEQENVKYDGMIMMMEQQRITLESMNLNQDVFGALKEATDLVKNNKAVDIEKFEDLKDDILEQQQMSEEINEFFKPTSVDGEEDILKELEAMEQENVDAELQGAKVPTASIKQTGTKVEAKAVISKEVNLDDLISS